MSKWYKTGIDKSTEFKNSTYLVALESNFERQTLKIVVPETLKNSQKDKDSITSKIIDTLKSVIIPQKTNLLMINTEQQYNAKIKDLNKRQKDTKTGEESAIEKKE